MLFIPALTVTTVNETVLPVNYALPCILRNRFGHREHIPSFIHACRSKRRAVREDPSEEGENEKRGPKHPPMPTPCSRSGRIERRRAAGELRLSQRRKDQCVTHHSVRDFATLGVRAGQSFT
jgi:hypothetical protein